MPSLAQKHYLAAIIWCVLLGVAYWVIDRHTRPTVAIATPEAARIEIPRSRDGHFYVAGRISGHPVTFMVDTGASTVSVGRTIADRLDLPKGAPVVVTTANGPTAAEEVTGQTLTLGGIEVRNIRILILPRLAAEALLGQNALRHMEVNQTAERMVLQVPPR